MYIAPITITGTECAYAAKAIICAPEWVTKPPLAIIAWALKITLSTLDISAYIDESGTRVVFMPSFVKLSAVTWPVNYGADSQTTTSKYISYLASLKNCSRMLLRP